MAKWTFIFVFLFSTISFGEASSEIPERREFPVNEELNPCEDFYEYTCSKVIESFKLREDRSAHTFSFSDSSERLLESKKAYLLALPEQKKKTKGEQELGDVFSACLNTEARALDERAEVKRVLEEIEKIKNREDFQKYLGSKMGTADFGFLDFGVIKNQKNPKINDLYVIGDLRGLPERSYYSNKKVVKAYKKLVASFFKELGLKGASARALLVFKFEKEFDKNYPTPSEMRELSTKFSEIKREVLLKDFEEFYLSEFLEKVPQKTLIRDFVPDNYKFLKKALSSYRLDQLKSVYLYHALSGLMDEGYKEFYDKKFKFKTKFLGGSNKRPELKERCTNYVKGSFMKELDYELYPKLFGNFSKRKFLKLVKKIRKSLELSLQNNTWLSAEGKKSAIKKMRKAFLQVVKPNNKKEWDMLPRADYSAESFLANKKIRTNLQNEKALGKLKKKNNNKVWGWGPLIVNAYYSPSDNKFVMPVGILQYPFYDQNLPDHMNLGAIGMVIGHELGHGVDDQGAKYDYKGRLKTWMTKTDIERFKQRGDRLVAQFDAIGHNGKLTLGENIGDLVGLTTAYQAAFPKGKGDLKAKKDFFLSYGRSWCSVMREGRKKLRLKTDPHSLPTARINEQVKHQAGFVEAFSCKAGDKMFLPEAERISIW